jgi:hypothetical protein
MISYHGPGQLNVYKTAKIGSVVLAKTTEDGLMWTSNCRANTTSVFPPPLITPLGQLSSSLLPPTHRKSATLDFPDLPRNKRQARQVLLPPRWNPCPQEPGWLEPVIKRCQCTQTNPHQPAPRSIFHVPVQSFRIVRKSSPR